MDKVARAGLEVALIGSLFGLYQVLRWAIGDTRAAAMAHAGQVLRLEGALALPDELTVQQLMLASDTVTRSANAFYAGVHFPLTAALLCWLYVRHRSDYVRTRNVLIVMTGMAMMVHAIYPLAPTRMLGGLGYVDTAAVYGPSVYGPPGDSVSNQFAAMPSLHFGWAVVVAWAVSRICTGRWRWIAVLHPVVTLLVIVGTGNHYWLDAAVAGGLFVAARVALERGPLPTWGTAVTTFGPRLRDTVSGWGVSGNTALALPTLTVPVSQLGHLIRLDRTADDRGVRLRRDPHPARSWQADRLPARGEVDLLDDRAAAVAPAPPLLARR